MWCLAVLVPATPAAAQSSVETSTPADGWYQPGSVTPVIVVIQADGAQSGTIAIEFEGSIMATQPFEIAGGSTKRFVVPTPTTPWSVNGRVIVETGDETISSRLALNPATDDEIVGVMPSLAARGLQATATLTVDTAQARLFAFDSTLLDIGPVALGSFTYLVAAPDDLEALGTNITAVEDWVIDGGRLIVDAAVDTPLPFDPGTPLLGAGSGNRFQLGSGMVEFTNNRISNSGFDGLITPTSGTSATNSPFGGFGTMPSTPFLAADAGVRVPEIGAIVLFLLAYIAVAGPIAYTLIRRSNREPALWLIVPALALLATGGVWAFGRQLRDNVNSAHATLVVDLPVGRVIATQVLVAAPGGGVVGVDLPETWRPTPASFDDLMMNMEFGQGQGLTTPFERNGELVVDLAPGGVAVVQAETRRPSAEDPAWLVSLDLVDDELIGTITNTTTHDLTEITISSGQAVQRVGSMAPGQTIDVKLGQPGRFVTAEDPLMSRMWQIDMNSNTSPVNPSVLSSWLANNPQIAVPDNVLVLGWTRAADGPLSTTNGGIITDGRTGYLTATPLVASNGLIGPATNRVRVLRGWESTRVTDQSRAQFEEFGVTLQITPASDPAGQDLVLAATRFVAAMDVWDGDAWVPAGMVDVADEGVFAIPDDALSDGSLYVRFQLGDEWWGRNDVFPTMRRQIPADDVLELARGVDG